ncbi:HupE/UreJ family protein [Hymenobacter amundsenii]|uniref:HupE/UreJ family protein n=1 Tax=Hymenobacter amundsenii TaxID=2006685 RepID=UPI0021CD2BCD|nr:HupE/UreJ family protein [Hymenobacter amundsenii]
MSVFSTYLQLGFYHIFNLRAYDHLVFLLALCAPYVLRDWRQVVALVTSFTVGHSLTLALATLDVVHYSPQLIETLIPVTIILTSLLNLARAAGPGCARPSGLRPARPLCCHCPTCWPPALG